MSLSAGSRPGTTICISSISVENNAPARLTFQNDRPPHAAAKPRGRNKAILSTASANHRKSHARQYENGLSSPDFAGTNVAARIASTIVPTSILWVERRRLVPWVNVGSCVRGYFNRPVSRPVTLGGPRASPKIRMNSPVPISHHFTVDVEEHFQVAAFEQHVSRSQWDTLPSRVHRGVRALLELLAERDAHGTFFILSWVAQRQPALVREIAEAGHEIASHGTDHQRITKLSRDAFRQSVVDSKAILEDVTGHTVLGYRAPSFSITRDVEWALDVLIETGYRYDSSLYPVRRDGYGFAGGERDPHVVRRAAGSLHEFPPATVQWGSTVLPAGGGAYFRHLPYTLIRSALSDAERRGVPGTFYIHPWELDPEQPRVSVPYRTHLRHYGGLTRTVPRLRKLLGTFQFQSIAHTLAVADRRAALGKSGESLALADER